MDFKLIVKAPEACTQPSFELEGSEWTLSPSFDLDNNDAAIPPFACVSYRWGHERQPHALQPELSMSSRALPSLAAAIRCCAGGEECTAFWTDVFCVPAGDGVRRQATLESMGYVYSRAQRVVIVLSERTLAAVEKLAADGCGDDDSLLLLERDEWVASLWTYQELANGGPVVFVGEQKAGVDARNVSLEPWDLLEYLASSLNRWRSSTGSDYLDAARRFPNLSLLEDLLLDYMQHLALQRSAFTVLSQIARKDNPDVKNYYYASLGTLTDSAAQLEWFAETSIAERFVAVCERRNDFSYIYSLADRDSDPGQRWRPRTTLELYQDSNVPIMLRPIITWHCWGEQLGHRSPEGLWLHSMTTMRPSETLQEEGRSAIGRWLGRSDADGMSLLDLKRATYKAITTAGFHGVEDPIITQHGLVFLTAAVDVDDIARVLISNKTRWAMGAPGLVHIENRNGDLRYVVCAFIGSATPLLDDGKTVLLK